MDRFPSFLPVFLIALLVGSPICWAQTTSDNETPHWEALPTEAPDTAAPTAPADSATTEPPPAIPVIPRASESAAPSVTAPSSAAPVTHTAAPVSKHYKVRIWQTNGECLWRIAEKVYGDRSKWRLIYLANKDVIHDPNKIYPNQRLKIPPSDWQP